MKQLFLLIFILINFCLKAEVRPEVVLTTGHSDYIIEMTTSPNGRFLASSGTDKVIKIWEVATTQEYRSLSGFDGRINDLIFSKDNIHLAGISGHGELFVWNVLTGEEVFHEKSGNAAMKGVAFSKDGTKIIHSNGDNGNLAITTIATGESKQEELYSTALAVDTNKQIVYVLDQLGNMSYFDLETESIVKEVKLFDEFNYPFSGMKVSNDGKFLACGFNDDFIRLYDTDLHQFVYEHKADGKVQTLAFDTKHPYLYVSETNGFISVFDYEKKKKLQSFDDMVFNAQSLTSHPRGNVVIIANNRQISFYDVQTNKLFKSLEGKTSPISWISHDPNNEYLLVANDDIKIQVWDLKLNKVVDEIQGFKPVQFSPDGRFMYYQNSQLRVGVYDLESQIEVGGFNTNSMIQMCMDVSDDGKLVAGGGVIPTINIWNNETKKLKGVLAGHLGMITAIDFHPTLPIVATSSYDQTTRIWDLKTLEEIQKFEDQTICVSEVKFSPDGLYLASAAWDQTIKVRKVEDWSTVYTLKGHKNAINSLDFNAESSLLVSSGGNNAVQESDNSVIVWDITNGEMKCQSNEHRTSVVKVKFDQNNGRVFSASRDGEIKVLDPTNCEVIATYVGTQDQEFAIYTPDNFYMSSRRALKGLAFRLNNQLVAFEQFDKYLNRPDVISERLGKSPQSIIKAYKYLYKKRLRQFGLSDEGLKIDYEVPHIKNESEIEIVTTEKEVKLWVSAWDEKWNIQQINVFVNDVPIYGEEGYRPTEKVKSVKKEFTIPLVNGANRIQFSCMNEKGAESIFETVDLYREGAESKHDLYLVSIGVSNYKDDRFKLTYPTKDAKDVAEKFVETREMYNEVHSKILLDEEVILENLAALDDFLAGCSHEDLVIVFVAGHGVLDENFDYFYGTYDMDFNEPSARGLPYSKIHGMLNKIKAYKKLLIMDTCHSGELDKDEIEEAPDNPEMIDGDIQFRSAGAGVRKKEGIGFDNSVKLLKDVFSDTRKGSGAHVISSAGGAEYALESDEWKNGLFTYALLSGLDKPFQVGNGDPTITVSEIRAYVNKRVEELSDGKQIPTAREENINQDYIIFETH